MDCYIVDIDGTVANIQNRLHHILKEEPDWDKFHEECDKDIPIHTVIDVVNNLWLTGKKIVFCTGRMERNREATIAWLEKHRLTVSILLMRKDGDHREDTVVKKEMYDYLVGEVGLNPIAAFEDRPSVCRMWRSLGLVCFQLTHEEF